MSHELITDLHDSRLEPYREMRNRNWTEQSGIFIAEGPLVVEQLLASDAGVQSLLVDEKYVEKLAFDTEGDFPVYQVAHDLVQELVGFKFHRGILGCGYRRPLKTLGTDFSAPSTTETMLALVGVQDPENLGGVLRTCAGLGIRRVFLGPGTADPYGRRALRVSMGTALSLDLYRATNAAQVLGELSNTHGVNLYATSLQDDALRLEACRPSGPCLIVLGNERNGVPAELQKLSDHRIRVEMELETDSLNVGVAAGIILHYFCRMRTRPAQGS